jgi:MraZ protein
MFLGEYQHSLDAKGRVILPARFREQLEGGAVMTVGVDGALVVYPPADFERVAQKLQAVRERGVRERQAAAAFFAGANEFTPDKQGRVAIPQNLRTLAQLEREVVVAGGYDHIEIWDAERYRERNAAGVASIVSGEGVEEFM